VRVIRSSIQRVLIAAAMSLTFGAAFQAVAQASPHLVLVKMVDKPNAQFGFEPATIVAERGDTVRFLQSSSAPHNVHFEKTPKGAKLGNESSGPYLIGQGKTYDLVIDARFTDGAYEFVCDPHESAGMHGTLTVGSSTH
jgi:plastocyanin